MSNHFEQTRNPSEDEHTKKEQTESPITSKRRSSGMHEETKKLKRHSDSFFTKLLARSISVYITRSLVNTSVTPLQVTMTGLLLGLFAAWLGSKPFWCLGILAALFVELSHILDCVDGELARLTGRGSAFAADLDPITDRIKDVAIIYAAFLRASQAGIFSLTQEQIFTISFLAVACWTFYMYLVDAFLNPRRWQKLKESSLIMENTTYFGLYDVFIYGSISFLLFDLFEYFVVFVLCVAVCGSLIQVVRLRNFAGE